MNTINTTSIEYYLYSMLLVSNTLSDKRGVGGYRSSFKHFYRTFYLIEKPDQTKFFAFVILIGLFKNWHFFSPTQVIFEITVWLRGITNFSFCTSTTLIIKRLLLINFLLLLLFFHRLSLDRPWFFWNVGCSILDGVRCSTVAGRGITIVRLANYKI